MKQSLLQASSEIKPFELAVAARGTARLTIPELAAMRKQPPACFSSKLAPLLLKHSDEQTLASLAALYRATADFGLESEDFDHWGIVSISRFLGRAAFAGMMDKYTVDGAWGVSVQLIPHRTAHSVAGTISLALGAHGPCIGVNGGMDGENTGLLALACLMQQRQWRGVWLVCSSWSPELAVDRNGQPISDSVCLGAALALVGGDQAGPLGHLRFEPHPCGAQPSVSAQPDVSLLDFLLGDDDRRTWHRRPASGLQIEIDLTVPAGVSS